MVTPFVALLAAIALVPLLRAGWWARHYAKVAFGLGSLTLAYYLLGLEAVGRVLHTAQEYVSFIVLIGSLFVVAGGIHLRVKGQATPLANSVFLFIGAVVANLLGTTGASMLLIRPWLRLNHYRVTAHHVVFFIFLVSNVGGCLTPIGDPPLFLGYLRGVPFGWTITQCWPMWLVGVLFLLACFYVVDSLNYRKAPRPVRVELAEPRDRWQFEGLVNLGFLGVIVAAVFVQRPVFVREAIMLVASAGSYFATRRSIHEANHFNFHPIREVAVLFAGIFATMMPALDWLQGNAGRFGDPSVGLYYWATGMLSSVLDNAPTYLSFLSAHLGTAVEPQLVDQVQQVLAAGAGALAGTPHGPVQEVVAVLQQHLPGAVAAGSVSRQNIEIAALLTDPGHSRFLLAISIGAVFFGANTYIGNGPNFMVKSIADQRGVHTPTFLGYFFKYTLPFMFPMLGLVWLLFFR